MLENETKAKWWWNIPIIFMILLFISLGIRSIITKDNRYGWGTFSQQIVYEVDYFWVLKSGERIRYIPGGELFYESKSKLDSHGNTRYSIGAVKSWVNNYVKYVYLNKKPGPEVISFMAEVEYAKNVSRRQKWYTIEDDKIHKIVFEYPKKNN